MTSEGESPVAVWNVTSNLCSACIDGRYEDCYCDDEFKLQKDLSCDSLDQCSDSENASERRNHHNYSNYSDANCYDDYACVDEFQDSDGNRQLPPSTTDWDSIDSVLEKELDYPDSDVVQSSVSCRLSQNVNMQMVFVDSEESDKGSDPDVEVYYDNNYKNSKDFSNSIGNMSDPDGRNIDSRDSGYLTTDALDINIEKVTDRRRSIPSEEAVEESTRVLASLQLHEELEEKRNVELEEHKKQEIDFISVIHQKNIAELKSMKDYLEIHIAQINRELLDQLAIRDDLYSHHQSLLMDADDLSKCNENTRVKESAVLNEFKNSSRKRSSTWWR